MTQIKTRHLLIPIFAGFALVMYLSWAAPSGAQSAIRVEAFGGTLIYPPGHEVDLGTHDTGATGLECDIVFRADNNESVWLGNDMYVRTGGATTVLRNVEASPGKVTTSPMAAIGPTATIWLRVTRSFDEGGGHFSLSGTVTFEQCENQSTTTTTTTTTVTVPPPTVTVPPTTLTVPPTTIPPAPPAPPVVVEPLLTG